MLFVRIRQAEVALADGRLDDAFELVQPQDVRAHRRGQAIITQLVQKLVERGQAHLAANRPTQAMGDCDKAHKLGGNMSGVVELLAAIEQAVVSHDRARRVQSKEAQLVTAAELVDSAVARNDLDAAVAELVRARANGCGDRRLRHLDDQVRGMLRAQIEQALNQGRLDQVEPLMQRLLRLDAEGLATQALARALEEIRRAHSAIDRGQAHEAQVALRRLGAQLPDAQWINEVLEHLVGADEALRAIRTGPLGLLGTSDVLVRDTGVWPVPVAPQHGRDARVTGLPPKFILQVDGAGSFLVVRSAQVTLGPISSSKLPDVALIAEPDAAVVSIERVDDDYFVRGAGSRLLSDGDRIELSPRCKLAFGLPNPSSTSAVLDVIAGRFPRADVRRVILLDRDLVIGPGAANHIRADHAAEPLVLHIRDARLVGRGQIVEVGVPTTIGGVSLAVTIG